MAKKIKNQKLLSNKNPSFRNYPGDSTKSEKGAKPKSVFGTYSEKLQQSKQKKIQKLKDTRNRVLNKKKENKLVRLSRNPEPGFAGKLNKNIKKNKFALLDEPEAQAQNRNKLTHKGKNLQQIRNFNDMHFDQDNVGQDSQDFDNQHAQLHFHGFDEENNNEQINNGRPKSKNEIYKQIIQKSKAHKRQRQQQYEQNFEAAVQLDEQFQGFVSQLKFRTADSKTRQKIEKKDREYQKLMNQLREDEKVIANKVVDNHKKGQEKIKKKKYIQLKQLMEGSDSNEEEDVRGWVKGIDEESQEFSDEEDQEIADGDQESHQQGEDEEDQDQIDDVQLSSNEDEDEDEDQDEEVNSEQDESQVEDLNKNRKLIVKDQSSDEIEKAEREQLRFGNKKSGKKMISKQISGHKK